MAFGGRGLPAPPFDAENLTYAFGFPVPPPFATLLNALCEDCGSAAAAYNRFEAAETMLSFEMQWDQKFGLFRSPFSSEWWPEVSARLRSLGIEPDQPKAGRNFENGSGKPITPILIPDGWRHVPSADGVGVLAPAALFHPAPLPAVERRPDISGILDAVSRHAADRFPATALWLAREGHFLSYGATELYPAMIDAYQALDRPSLAAVVSRRMGHAR